MKNIASIISAEVYKLLGFEPSKALDSLLKVKSIIDGVTKRGFTKDELNFIL